MWEGYKRPEIASKKWSRYFKIASRFILKEPRCCRIGYTSNLEQHLLASEKIKKLDVVEIFVHPKMIEDINMDTSSSYLKNKQKTMNEVIEILKNTDKITVNQLKEKINR